MGTLRTAAAVLAGILLVGLVIRDAAVRSMVDEHPDRARAIWANYPDAVIRERMIAIGKAANLHRPVNEALTAPIINVARVSPLSIEPFLVKGVQLQGEGKERLAGRLFVAAQQRNPRAIAPYLLLAANYYKMGLSTLSLVELGKLIRLVPGAAGELAPKIAQSIQQAGGPSAIRSLVSQSPELRADLLRAMATNARNFDFVLSLQTAGASRDWQPVMIQSLVGAGQYQRAYDLWAISNRVKAPLSRRGYLIDPAFRLSVPSPFGWTLSESGPGVAEPADTEGLHILAYGREGFTAAYQTLLLGPGNYVLSQKTRTTAGDPTLLQWRIICLPQRQVGAARLVSDRIQARFTIPGDCPAQRIELVASAPDVPETLEATLEPLDIKRVG